MKSRLISAALGLAWCLALTSVGLAQEAEPLSDVREKTVPAVPVADAKKRLRDAQKHLDKLSKSKNSFETFKLSFETLDGWARRDQMRAAVAEAFDARRQLQQSELAELERRIANIKRALQISDAMRETIIDQRTDELLDQIEEGGKSDERGGSARPGGSRPGDPGAKNESTAAPDQSSVHPSVKRDAELLALGVREAEANLESAKRAYQRVEKLFANGAVEQAILDEQADKYNRAQLQVERAEVELNAFIEEHAPAAAQTPPAERDATWAETSSRINALNAKLALEEAKANLAAAENKYEYSKKMHSKGYVTEQEVEAKASELERAKIRLELAKTEFEAVASSGGDDDEANASDPSTLRLLQLDVEEAEASLKAAERNHARLQANHARGAATQEQLDEAADKLKHAKIQVERARVKLDARGKAQKSSLDRGPIDQERVVWGSPVGHLQLGWDVKPRKKAYLPGDVLTVALLIRNTGDQAIDFYSPPSNSLERMELDFTLLTVDGEKLQWEWGPAHKDPKSLTRIERFRDRFAPGGVYGLPPFKLSVGEPADTDASAELMAGLDVHAGQTARLSFKLSPVDWGSGDAIELQTQPFEFRVEEAKRR